MKIHTGLLVLFALLAAQWGYSQEAEEGKNDAVKDLKKEVVQLRAALDSLRTLQLSGQTDQEDELERTEDRLEKRLQGLENKIDAVSRASAPTVLNPRTVAFINFAARGDSKQVYDAADPAKQTGNRPYLRSAELELSNPVDPYADAVIVMSVENQAGKDFAVDAEEAYGIIKRVPLLETAPLGLKVKIGKFRAPLGLNNKIHMHDLPWTTRPLVIASYLGTDHGDFFESGFNPTGIDLNFFLPSPVPDAILEMNFDVVRAGELAFSQGHAGGQPAYVGHLNLSRDWANEHLLVVGLSAYDENGTANTRLFGADLTYKWAPVEERESRSLVAGGEIFAGRHSFMDTSGRAASSSYGWYGYVQYQTSYWVYLGLRYDWLQDPADNRIVTKSAAAYLSYYTTEFLRFRLGFEHRNSGIPALDNVNSGFLEVNFVFGSHPTEPYWVNK